MVTPHVVEITASVTRHRGSTVPDESSPARLSQRERVVESLVRCPSKPGKH